VLLVGTVASVALVGVAACGSTAAPSTGDDPDRPSALPLPLQPFLRGEPDLNAFGPNTGVGPWSDVSSAPLPIEWTCLSDPMSWGAAEAKTTRYRIDSGRGSGSRIREYVLRFDTPAVARIAAHRLADDLAGCPTGPDERGTVSTRGPQHVPGLYAERFWIYRTRTDSDRPDVFDVATARQGVIVVVLQYTGRGLGIAEPQPDDEGSYPRALDSVHDSGFMDNLWAWSPKLLSAALDRAAPRT
jgi:hypothetical protein